MFFSANFVRAASFTAVVIVKAHGATIAHDYASVDTFVHMFDGSNPSTPFCMPPTTYDANSAATVDGDSSRKMIDTSAITSNVTPLSSTPKRGDTTTPRYPVISLSEETQSAIGDFFTDVTVEMLLTADKDFMSGLDAEGRKRLTAYLDRLRTDVDGTRSRFAAAMKIALSAKDAQDVVVNIVEDYQVKEVKEERRLQASEVPEENLDPVAAIRSHWSQLVVSDMFPAMFACILKDSTSKSNPTEITIDYTASEANLASCACTAAQEGLTKTDGLSVSCAFIDLVMKALGCPAYGNTWCPEGVPQFTPPGFDTCTVPLGSGSSSTDANTDYDMWLSESSAVRDADGKLYAEIPDAVKQQEGLTYYYGYRATQELMDFTTAALCGNETLHEVIPGWTTRLLINNLHEGDELIDTLGRGSIPYATVATRGCDALVVLRGTYSAYEWRVNFAFNQAHSYYTAKAGGQRVPKGNHHQGFSAIASSIQPTFETFYDSFIQDNGCAVDTNRRIIVVGHSLGAGVGSVLTHLLGARYHTAVQMYGLFYGVPAPMDTEGVQDLEQLASTRSFVMMQDPITGIPCSIDELTHGLPACPGGLVKTGPAGSFSPATVFNGRVTVTPEQLVEVSGSSAWTEDTLFGMSANVSGSPAKLSVSGSYMKAATFQFDATHVCSYACYVGQYCRDPTEAQWRCAQDAKRGSSSTVQMYEPCNIYGRNFAVEIAL